MKKENTITYLSIDELIADTGQTKSVNDFHVFTSEELDREKRTSKPLRIDHFIIILAIKGTASIRLNLTGYQVEKNDLLIISPNVIHEVINEIESGFIGMGFIPEFLAKIGFSKKHADVFTFFSIKSQPLYQLSQTEAKTLYQLMLALQEKDRAVTNHPFKEELIFHTFNLFMFELAAIVQRHRGNEPVQLTRKEEILISFLKILPEHFKEERSVQYYADQLFITPKHLTKTVKELTNKTCGEFIDEMVIIEAKVLLGDASLSVGNVADHLHFSDQFFFSKFFKNLTGLTPTEFRSGG